LGARVLPPRVPRPGSASICGFVQLPGTRSPSGAENVMRAIYASIAFLAENPLASQETGVAEIRVRIVRR